MFLDCYLNSFDFSRGRWRTGAVVAGAAAITWSRTRCEVRTRYLCSILCVCVCVCVSGICVRVFLSLP